MTTTPAPGTALATDCRRCRSYASLVKAKEAQLAHVQVEASAGREAIATLASEREMNAVLTAEVELLRASLAAVPASEPVDVKAIHSAVLALRVDPAVTMPEKVAFQAGVHRAAAVVSGFSNVAAEPAEQRDVKTSIFDKPKEGQEVKARIKRGAVIGQDFRSMKWPTCLAPGGQKVDPEMVFDAVWNGRYWDCRAHGYGKHGQPDSYGNGSIFVSNVDDVHIVDPSAEAQVPAGTDGEQAPTAAAPAPVSGMPDLTKLGEQWHIRYKGGKTLATVTVEEITTSTVLILSGDFPSATRSRYALSDLEFIEKINPVGETK